MKGKLAREIRRKAAEERQQTHNKLTIEQKIAKLDDMFGKDQGAKKERAKLQSKLEVKNSKDAQVEKVESKKINKKDKKTSPKEKTK